MTTTKTAREFHRCTQCGVSFRTSKQFNAHECVKQLEALSLEELMKQYEQQRAK